MLDPRTYYWNKLDGHWRNRCLLGEISEEQLEVELDRLEGMLSEELEGEYNRVLEEGR